jgi:hypothetical protein
MKPAVFDVVIDVTSQSSKKWLAARCIPHCSYNSSGIQVHVGESESVVRTLSLDVLVRVASSRRVVDP